MRVTQGMLSNSMLRNLSSSYRHLDTLNNQVATGKKITRPSQDPVIATKGIGYRTSVAEVEQFQRNISEAHSWIESADDALSKGVDVLQRFRELTVNAANGTNDDSAREAIAQELEQLKEHLETISNTKYGEKYIFNGANTTTQPVDLKAGTFPNGYTPVNIQVSPNSHVEISMDATSLFSKATFDGLDDVIAKVRSGESTAISNSIAKVDEIKEGFISERSAVGARQNRMELIDERLQTQEVIAKRVMSENEDADIEEVITQLKMQEMVHRASLGVGARIIQPTLMDFLR
ncbi:flagellar hook-associated protein FlgL [Priestia taiwanensis]|uniref:Flagellar hook-associated protein 3 n=1 Tax=Priestia taiwanensis TaxID=1347902 RepID=A0A917AX40_9BACI|nr:flagellar hook-associated protein FlgL [Priestia taiwanensis]MBM7364378.1 flagellar hook-associated protein 3 FlgL [Priestia taiwanensis]GGE84920.1 flagellar hook-associated protein 3 [Priestia taiwanensis]